MNLEKNRSYLFPLCEEPDLSPGEPPSKSLRVKSIEGRNLHMSDPTRYDNFPLLKTQTLRSRDVCPMVARSRRHQ